MNKTELPIGAGANWDRVTIHRPDVTIAIDLASGESKTMTFREAVRIEIVGPARRGMEAEAMLGRQPWPGPIDVANAIFAQFEREVRCS